ncbi:hypothetical protein G9A89_015764 [Geosiphon pyriformis]|nr:hypothetical protein G9A89_015764 [Geosiphon pyriformis]
MPSNLTTPVENFKARPDTKIRAESFKGITVDTDELEAQDNNSCSTLEKEQERLESTLQEAT